MKDSIDRITLDFIGDDDLSAQLNVLDNEQLKLLSHELADVINMRIECGEMED